MINRIRGIVLHTVNYSETSVIAKIYTDLFGVQSYMLNGVRKQKSKLKAVLLQPLTIVEFIAHQKENRDIHRITEISGSPSFTNIPYDITKSSIAFFISEILYKCIREEEADDKLFSFLENHIQLLDQTQENCKQYHHYFLMQLTKHLGFFPHGEFNEQQTVFDLREGVFMEYFPPYPEFVTGTPAQFLFQMSNVDFENHHVIDMKNEERRVLLQTILRYYELHALHGSKINSHKVLEEVLG